MQVRTTVQIKNYISHETAASYDFGSSIVYKSNTNELCRSNYYS